MNKSLKHTEKKYNFPQNFLMSFANDVGNVLYIYIYIFVHDIINPFHMTNYLGTNNVLDFQHEECLLIMFIQ